MKNATLLNLSEVLEQDKMIFCHDWPQGMPGLSLHRKALLAHNSQQFLDWTLSQPADQVQFWKSLSFQHDMVLLQRFFEILSVTSEDDLRSFFQNAFSIQHSEVVSAWRWWTECPVGFRQWCQEHQVRIHDLLNLVYGTRTAIPALKVFHASKMNKNQGLQFLEYLMDLTQMHISLVEIESCTLDEALFQKVRQMRFQTQTQQDSSMEKQFQKISWPMKIQARWQRRGDTAGAELKLFIQSPLDLQKHIVALQKTQETLLKEQSWPTKN